MKEIVPGLWDIDEIGDQVHAYLWQWQQGFTLIDTGMPSHAPIILEALKKRSDEQLEKFQAANKG